MTGWQIILIYLGVYWVTFFLVVMTEYHHTETSKGHSTSMLGEVLLCVFPPFAWYHIARYWLKEWYSRLSRE